MSPVSWHQKLLPRGSRTKEGGRPTPASQARAAPVALAWPEGRAQVRSQAPEKRVEREQAPRFPCIRDPEPRVGWLEVAAPCICILPSCGGGENGPSAPLAAGGSWELSPVLNRGCCEFPGCWEWRGSERVRGGDPCCSLSSCSSHPVPTSLCLVLANHTTGAWPEGGAEFSFPYVHWRVLWKTALKTAYHFAMKSSRSSPTHTHSGSWSTNSSKGTGPAGNVSLFGRGCGDPGVGCRGART